MFSASSPCETAPYAPGDCPRVLFPWRSSFPEDGFSVFSASCRAQSAAAWSSWLGSATTSTRPLRLARSAFSEDPVVVSFSACWIPTSFAIAACPLRREGDPASPREDPAGTCRSLTPRGSGKPLPAPSPPPRHEPLMAATIGFTVFEFLQTFLARLGQGSGVRRGRARGELIYVGTCHPHAGLSKAAQHARLDRWPPSSRAMMVSNEAWREDDSMLTGAPGMSSVSMGHAVRPHLQRKVVAQLLRGGRRGQRPARLPGGDGSGPCVRAS